MKAALQAKQKEEVEQAKLFLRTAKTLDPLIEAACSGKPVDLSAVRQTLLDLEDFLSQVVILPVVFLHLEAAVAPR